jgi:hypothetical protein
LEIFFASRELGESGFGSKHWAVKDAIFTMEFGHATNNSSPDPFIVDGKIN